MEAYVVHVRGNTQREQLVRRELAKAGLKPHFILEGNREDLSQELLRTWFSGKFQEPSPDSSCVYKHFKAYERLLESQDSHALVFEDDILLYQDFADMLERVQTEIQQRGLCGYLISLEDSALRYVAGRKRRKDQVLYREAHGRMAGAILIDRLAAEALLQRASQVKCATPVDWFHNAAADAGQIQIYWLHPPICVQASHNGALKSILDDKTAGSWRKVSFTLQRWYKQLLYLFR
jgi:GR25 family glycosyltransferase involved in LPS biosynthesis